MSSGIHCKGNLECGLFIKHRLCLPVLAVYDNMMLCGNVTMANIKWTCQAVSFLKCPDNMYSKVLWEYGAQPGSRMGLQDAVREHL